MNKVTSTRLLGSTFLLALLAAPPAVGGNYDTPEECWESFTDGVASRDEVEVLASYQPSLRSQLSGDGTAAGRARLRTHMAEMFELLSRDYDYNVTDRKEHGNKVTFTIKFLHKKKGIEHVTDITFIEDEERWYVHKVPELPGFLTAGQGTITMIAGIVIALLALGFLAKKALG